VRYFAGARAAAGRSEETIAAGTLAELIEQLHLRHGDQLQLVLKSCSFLVDGLNRRDWSNPISAQSTVDVLPPFAGG
jgi:molybdopterin converting factor small subunit